MKFKELELNHRYDSHLNDVFNEFFNTVLPHTNYYRRLGGIFSARKFTLFAEGLQDFIKENRGIMELAIIPVFSEDEKTALQFGTAIDDVITKNWINDLSQIKEKFLEDHKKALAWMIVNGHLTIKIILPEHEDGTLLTESELKDHPLFRREVGILNNKDDFSTISFAGTIDRDNEIFGELYEIDVFKDWIDGDVPRIESNLAEFSNFWDTNEIEEGPLKCKIKPLSIGLKEYFEKIAPKSISDIPQLRKPPILREYQKKAVANWEKNGYRGIFEMATGTGKTYTAIGCIKKILDTNEKNLIIITAPFTNIIDQWKTSLSNWFIDSTILEKGWERIIHDEVIDLNKPNTKRNSVFIISHKLFSHKKFVEQIENCQISTMLVMDEAHHAGTEKTREGLSNNYTYRLALSATIERYFDQDGTDVLQNYFTGTTGKYTVFQYTLEEAIHSGMLCKYNYHPNFVELTEDEFIQYKIKTHNAMKFLNSKDPVKRQIGITMIMKRSEIIRDAANKIYALREILKQFKKIKYLLIFCSEKQYDDLYETLGNLSKYCNIDTSLKFRKITYNNPSDKKERIKILRQFADEKWDALLSNKVLDEGMDIPQAKNCIILASTGNPTQFIQRRGRVLRIFEDTYRDGSKKIIADIYDVLVKPRLDGIIDPDVIKLEIGIIKGQLSRIEKMSQLAENNQECLEKIKEFKSNLPPEVFENNIYS